MNTWLNLALPKGRLGEDALHLLQTAGFNIPHSFPADRRLLAEDPKQKMRYLWVKPVDVPVYVETGIAEIGIVGKDVLLEQGAEVYEMLDLNFGRCSLVLAHRQESEDAYLGRLRVATAYPHLANLYFNQQQRPVELVPLHGSVELAPLVGLADAIVDLTETGDTLRANRLKITAILEQISARLIVNPSALRLRKQRIQTFGQALEWQVSQITNQRA